MSTHFVMCRADMRMVAVGTRIAPRPPHRSRRALLTHRALIEGQTRSAFGVLGTHTAPIRGLAASVTCHNRRCVRDIRRCLPFLRSAAFPPPSPPPMSLGIVRGLIGTMQPSDSSCLPGGLRSVELPRQARNRPRGYGQHEASQVPYKGRLHVHGVSDCARLLIRKPLARGGCCLLFTRTRSAPRNSTRFAAQYPAHGLPCERFTLALAGSPCITRGRGGWLGLTPRKTCTSYPLPACPGALRLGSTFRRQRIFAARRRSLA